MPAYYGEIAALLTAVFWTITALAFESATRKVGTYAVNIIRLLIAFVLIGILTKFTRGYFLPIDASTHSWIWLMISGIIGFVIGDLFLFASYPIITSRVSMLIMTLVPPFTAVIGWLMLEEKLSIINVIGMLMVISGIGTAIWSRENGAKKISFKLPIKGVLYALIGTIGQAIGLVLSKYGMEEYDAFAATHIRIIAGIIGFVIMITVLRKWKNVIDALYNRGAMKPMALGSFFGPFLGVSFSLIAVKYTLTGVASTLMAIVPVLIIVPAILIFKQKVSRIEIIGAFISVCGVALFFI